MIKKDMRTGIVYGFKSNSYVRPLPAIVLDTSTLWEYRYNRFNQSKAYTPSTRTRPGSLSNWETWRAGYLAVYAYGVEYDDSGRAQAIADLKAVAKRVKATVAGAADGKLTPEHVEAINQSLPDRLHLQVINNRKLVGTWEEADAECKADEERAHREAEERRKLGQWRQDAFAVLEEAACRTAGTAAIVLRSEEHGRVSMGLETLARILGVELPELEE